jgi:hypothetical protein
MAAEITLKSFPVLWAQLKLKFKVIIFPTLSTMATENLSANFPALNKIATETYSDRQVFQP